MLFLKNMLYGIIIGVSNIIPGVSGGTMAVILNVYDKLIFSISHIRYEFKKSSNFLLAIALGATAGIFIFSNIISYFLDDYYIVTNMFFIGVIIGSIPMVYKKATNDKFKIYHIMPFLITTFVMIFIAGYVPSQSDINVDIVINSAEIIKLMIVSAVSGFCMIIPGISGSFIMLIFGTYEIVTLAISELNLALLIPIGLSSLVGVVFGAILIENLIKRYPQATYFSILGFMVGCIPSMLQKIIQSNHSIDIITIIVGIIVTIIGVLISYSFNNKKIKN